MSWKINIIETAKDELCRINKDERKKIHNYLTKKVVESNPRRYGRALQGKMFRLWKYNVGGHKIVCKLDSKKITVLSVSQSKNYSL